MQSVALLQGQSRVGDWQELREMKPSHDEALHGNDLQTWGSDFTVYAAFDVLSGEIFK